MGKRHEEILEHDLKSEQKTPPRILYEDSTKESLYVDLAEGHKVLHSGVMKLGLFLEEQECMIIKLWDI